MSMMVPMWAMIGIACAGANMNVDGAKCLLEITNLEVSVSPQEVGDCVRTIVAQGEPVIARKLIATARNWASDLGYTEANAEAFVFDETARRKSTRLGLLVSAGIEDMDALVGDPRPVLELVVQLAGRCWVSLGTQARCREILARSQAPKPMRHEYIVRLVEANRRR